MAASAARKYSVDEWDAAWNSTAVPAPKRRTQITAKPSAAPTKQTRKREIRYVAVEHAPGNIRRVISLFIISFAVLAVVVSRYAAISQKNLANSKLQASINTLETEIEIMDVELESKADVRVIQSRAEDQLNMNFANVNQIRYLNVAEPQRAEAEQEDEGFNLFDLLSQIRSILE